MRGKARAIERRGKPSHREDLRKELLDAGRAVLVREGYEALSMRKLAEEIGVSSAAPYHHFPDRRSLLVALAVEGYRAMFAASNHGVKGDDLREALRGLLRNFLKFASENRRLFALMYESELVREPLEPEIQQVQNIGYRDLYKLVAMITPALTERQRGVRLATIWSAVFGFALQSNHAMIRTPQPEPEAEELADEVVNQALRLLEP